MGLYDRDYMREEPPRFRRASAAPWSPTIALLVLLAVIFVVQGVFHMRNSAWMELHFGLSLNGIRHGQFWQLFSFQFLHGGLFHILLNGISLYSFGRILEKFLGRKKFVLLYFISGTCGGVLQIIASALLGQNPYIPVVGASAGIAGLLAAFIMCNPEARLIIFPIPVPVRAWTMLWFVLALSIYGTVFPFGGIAHAAHLGGLFAGGLFIRWLRKHPPQRDPDWLVPPVIRHTAQRPPEPPRSSMDDEVNVILDKINAQGIQSLTDRERQVLDRARQQIGRR